MERMKQLVATLNKAAEAYYNKDNEIMNNYEYDALFDELVQLEKQTGIILPDSPTQKAGYEVSGKLQKSEHETPALSLSKTKDANELATWLGKKKGVLSWKLDGLTIVATYDNGELTKAVTRGNGLIGEDVTTNARNFRGLPQKISYKGHLVIRGEAVITYSEFNRINNNLNPSEEPYKNPRNLASGTVRALDEKICQEREVRFYAFQVVSIETDKITGFMGDFNSFMHRLNYMKSLGFDVVERETVDDFMLKDTIYKNWEPKVSKNDVPTDGLVLVYDDIEYGESLGMTGRYPRYGMAFKWKDETQQTKLKEVFWSASRTGLLNPVAVFEPVEIDGTIERASLHNVSIMNSLSLHAGDQLEIYKANMIIPQIARNLDSNKSGELLLPPKTCPVCGAKTEIKTSGDGQEEVITLHCPAKDCPAKHIGKFERFVCRDAMNIEGMSTRTIETFISAGLLHSLKDIFYLKDHEKEITKMEGFGQKSFDNLIAAIEKSRNVTFEAFLYSIGIPLVGRDVCKLLGKAFGGTSEQKFSTFMERIRFGESFQVIDGIGPVVDNNIYKWKADQKATEEFADVVDEIHFVGGSEEVIDSKISGKTFVITGSVYTYKNRDSLKEFIEQRGGKVSGSVSSKTDYLINNDTTSTSGKNKKAKELGIPIISEEEFNNMAQ